MRYFEKTAAGITGVSLVPHGHKHWILCMRENMTYKVIVLISAVLFLVTKIIIKNKYKKLETLVCLMPENESKCRCCLFHCYCRIIMVLIYIACWKIQALVLFDLYSILFN